MKKTLSITLSLILLLINLTAAGEALAQGGFELRGTVGDESNAYLAAVTVTLEDEQGNKQTTVADDIGQFRFTNIKPGIYTISVEVEGFARFEEQIDLTTRRTAPFNIRLKVMITEQVEVKNEAGISPEPDKNLSAITLTEKDLEALPDDPDELLATLRQMAGAAGEEAAIYVGGFRERGGLPPKEAIQRININMNPFSAEYNEPGHARFEIITKPGSDTFHGGFNLSFNDESMNSRDPFASFKAPYQTRTYGGHLSGPIIRNRWGFFFDFYRTENDNNDVVNATVLDPVTFLPEPFFATIVAPTRNLNFSIRTDYLATKKHTLGFQFRHSENESRRGSGGGFNLPERGSITSSSENTIRFSLTTIATERAVNEMRLQLSRRRNDSLSITDAIAINVLDSFNGGGSQQFTDNENQNLDFTDTLTYTYKTHTIKAGFRAEGERLKNLNQSNFGGTFTFGRDFERNPDGSIIIGPDGAPIAISSIELYSRVVRGVPGYRPSQFSINRGDPFIGFSQWEMGWFIQDDWRVTPQFSLSYGVRHDFQTHLQDKINIAPRLSAAWSPKGTKNTIRVGGGIFNNWINTGITSDTIRLDGLHQQQFVIINPNFFTNVPPDLGGATPRQSTIRIKDEELNAPYTIRTDASFERQFPRRIFGAVTYRWIRGVHLLRSRNINAPVAINNGQPVLPFPGQGPIFQFESTGTSERHELSFNVRGQINPRFNFFGGYTLGHSRNDTDGAYSNPADPYDLSTEWGRDRNDSRHSMYAMVMTTLPWDVRVFTRMNAWSSRPFNIVTGRDNNRDSVFSDRPSFADPDDPGAIVTPFGTFNPDPRPGEEIIPRNFGEGPGFFTVSMGISKTIGFGAAPNNFPRMAAGQSQGQQSQQNTTQAQNQNQRGNRGGDGGRRGGGGGGSRAGAGSGGGGPQMMVQRGGGGGGMVMGGPFGGGARHKYNLTFGIDVNNIFNRFNPGPYNGTLTSPFFGIANRGVGGGGPFGGSGGARNIRASLRFNF
ncbi:MAG TPA: carboxypeptidase regulatory-like domain-containing protein [Blastocatellia bacterium]